MAITVPRFGPELINWALSDEYHDVPGGHIRIYRRRILKERLRSVGLDDHRSPLRPRAAQSVLVAEVSRRHDERRPTSSCKLYHRLLVWDIMKAPWPTRCAEAVLAPLMGKSIVVYLVKPA